jgi:phage-related holin
VTSDYLYGSIDGEIKMGIQVLLRFIIVNFLSAFLKKDIIFDAKSVDFEFEVQVDNVQD